MAKRKLSAEPVVTALLAGDRLPVLRRAQDEPDAAKRNPTVGLAALREGLGVNPATNYQRGGPFYVKYRSHEEAQASAVANGYAADTPGFGAALFDVPGNLVCIGAQLFVEEDHDGATVTAHVAYIAYFDDRPAGALGQFRGYLDGTFTPLPLSPDGLVPLRWYKQGSQEAANALVPRWSATLAGLLADKSLVKTLYDGDASDSFFTALQNGGPFPRPVKGQTDAYWRPAAAPLPVVTPPANLLRGVGAKVTYLHSEEIVNGNGSALLALPDGPNGVLCLGYVATVEIARQDGVTYHNQDYYLVYDSSPTPQLRVYQDGYLRLASGGDGLFPAKWVRAGSEEAAQAIAAIIMLYDAAYNQWQPGQDMKILLGGIYCYFVNKHTSVGGPYPAPTSASQETADWRPTAPPQAAPGLLSRVYQRQAQWQDLLDNSRVVPGQPYALEYAGGVLLVDGGQDSDNFAGLGELLLSNAQGVVTSQAVLANAPAGTWQPVGGTVDAYTKAQADARFATSAQLAVNTAAIYGRYRGPWAPNTAYVKGDWVIRPDTLVPTAAKVAFTSGSSFAAANWTDILQLGLQLFGDPNSGNLSIGVFGPGNTLGTGCKYNLFYSNGYHSFGANCKGNTVGLGNAVGGIELADNCIGNHFGSNVRSIQIGLNGLGNTLGDNVNGCQLEANVSNCQIAAGSYNILIRAGSSDCVVGSGCAYLTLGQNCRRVRVYQTAGTGGSNGNVVVIPDNTTDATYVNGVLQASTGGTGTGTQLLEVLSDSTNRVARLKLLKALALQAPVVQASANVSGCQLQVNAYRNGAWVAGTPRTSLADAQADIAALSTADYAAGAELEVLTVAVNSASQATLLLPVAAGADCFGFLTSSRASLKTNSNAPPAGYAGITALGDYEETRTDVILLSSGFSTGAGAVHSAGACVVATNAANVSVTVNFWLSVPCRLAFVGLTDPSLGMLTLKLDGDGFDTADQSPSSNSYYQYYLSGIVSPGEHTLVVTGQSGKTMLWDMFRLLAA